MTQKDAFDKRLLVEDTLAQALDMYSPRTSPRMLAGYVAEQADMPKTYFLDELHAVKFLVAIALALTPPDDRRMSFRDRPVQAANAATPWDFGTALDTAIELGFGALSLPGPATIREAGECVRDALNARAQKLALTLLEKWEQLGRVYRV